MSSTNVKKCWVTLATMKSYLPGVICLAKSLMRVKSKFPLLVLLPNIEKEKSDLVREDYDELIRLGSDYIFNFIKIKEIERVDPNNKQQYIQDYFPDTLTKLRIWEIEMDLIVFLDADMCVIRNMDELFELELANNMIAACHACTCNPLKISNYPKSWKPENCAYTNCPIYPESSKTPPTTNSESYFNSGIMVLHPSKTKFEEIYQIYHKEFNKFKFVDQDLLNEVFKGNWIGLPYVYNALKTLRKYHSAIWSDEDVKNVHYILDKPWKENIEKMRMMKEEEKGDLWVLNNWWWKVYRDEEWTNDDFMENNVA